MSLQPIHVHITYTTIGAFAVGITASVVTTVALKAFQFLPLFSTSDETAHLIINGTMLVGGIAGGFYGAWHGLVRE